jgi:hypothetical protein
MAIWKICKYCGTIAEKEHFDKNRAKCKSCRYEDVKNRLKANPIVRCIPAQLNKRKGNRYWPDMAEVYHRN